MGIFVQAHELSDAFRPRKASTRSYPRRAFGLGDLSDSGFVIYSSAQEALKQPGAYGYLYNENGQVKLSGPYGALIVKSVSVYPSAQDALKQPGAYGYIYAQNGQYWLSGPAGPLQVRSPYVESASPTQPVLSLPKFPTVTVAPSAPAPAPTVAPAPAAPSGPTPEQIKQQEIAKQTESAVAELKTRIASGEIQVYAAPADGNCPADMERRALPDGSVVCIDPIKAKAEKARLENTVATPTPAPAPATPVTPVSPTYESSPPIYETPVRREKIPHGEESTTPAPAPVQPDWIRPVAFAAGAALLVGGLLFLVSRNKEGKSS